MLIYSISTKPIIIRKANPQPQLQLKPDKSNNYNDNNCHMMHLTGSSALVPLLRTHTHAGTHSTQGINMTLWLWKLAQKDDKHCAWQDLCPRRVCNCAQVQAHPVGAGPGISCPLIGIYCCLNALNLLLLFTSYFMWFGNAHQNVGRKDRPCSSSSSTSIFSSSQWQPESIISRSTQRERKRERARRRTRERMGEWAETCVARSSRSWSWSHLEANFSGHTTLARFSIVATIIVINSFMCSVLIQLTKFAQDAPVEAGKKESEEETENKLIQSAAN